MESLQLSRRLGTQAGQGALVGVPFAIVGFVFGYCVDFLSSSGGCAKNLDDGVGVGLVLGGSTALIGAGIGWMISRYSPFEAVDLEGARSRDLDRVGIKVLPHPDGRIGLGVTVGVGGGR